MRLDRRFRTVISRPGPRPHLRGRAPSVVGRVRVSGRLPWRPSVEKPAPVAARDPRTEVMPSHGRDVQRSKLGESLDAHMTRTT